MCLATGTDSPKAGQLTREAVEGAYKQFMAMEVPLQEQVLNYLNSKPSVTIVGPSHGEAGKRVSTISFVVKGQTSKSVATALHQHNIACRYLWFPVPHGL